MIFEDLYGVAQLAANSAVKINLFTKIVSLVQLELFTEQLDTKKKWPTKPC